VIVQWAHTLGFGCAGRLEAPHNIGWSSLPYHLGELILFRLSLLELARISTTCHTFREAFCRQMVHHQEARCNLVLHKYGRERIARVAALLNGFSRGEFVARGIYKDSIDKCWISVNGGLHIGEPNVHQVGGSAHDHHVAVSLSTPSLLIEVYGSRWSQVHLSILRGSRVVKVCVQMWDDEDLEGLGLVQALMSGGLIGSFKDAVLSFEVEVQGYSRERFTSASVQVPTILMPLLPLASRYTTVKSILVMVHGNVGKYAQRRG
jgi:hypothetical protein